MEWTFDPESARDDVICTVIDGEGWQQTDVVVLSARITLTEPRPDRWDDTDMAHALTPAQRAVAEEIAANPHQVFARLVFQLREQVGPDLDEDASDDDDDWDDDDDDDEDPYAVPEDEEFVSLFDDPDEFEDDEYEEGYDDDHKPKALVDRITVAGIRIRSSESGKTPEYVIYGRCDWDEEHGFGVVFRGTECVDVGGMDLSF